MFQEVEVWRGGEKPEAAFLVALESLENHSCGKNVTTSPMDELSDLCYVLLLQDSVCVCVCVSHPTPHESHHEKNEKTVILLYFS